MGFDGTPMLSRCSLCLYRSLNIGVPPNPIFGEIYMMPAGTPILVLKEGTRRERGKGAQFNNIAAAKAVADAVRSTLGPRGMDKMLVDSLGDVVITNDGVTILKEIDIEHPAAKMLVEVAKTQDEEAGDGTTTAVILAGELLKKAEDLIDQNIHPTVIAAGYRQASDKAREVLEKVATKISIKELDTLKKVGMTSMSSKSASGHKELLADIAVKAVTTVAEQRADGSYFVDDDNIQIVKKQGGSIADTQLVDGIIVDKERVHPGMHAFLVDDDAVDELRVRDRTALLLHNLNIVIVDEVRAVGALLGDRRHRLHGDVGQELLVAAGGLGRHRGHSDLLQDVEVLDRDLRRDLLENLAGLLRGLAVPGRDHSRMDVLVDQVLRLLE